MERVAGLESLTAPACVPSFVARLWDPVPGRYARPLTLPPLILPFAPDHGNSSNAYIDDRESDEQRDLSAVLSGLATAAAAFVSVPFLRLRRLGIPVALTVTTAEAAVAERHAVALAAWGVHWAWGRFETRTRSKSPTIDAASAAQSSHMGDSDNDDAEENGVITCLHQGSLYRIRIAAGTDDCGDDDNNGNTVLTPLSQSQAQCMVIRAVPSVCGVALEPARDVREMLAALDEHSGGTSFVSVSTSTSATRFTGNCRHSTAVDSDTEAESDVEAQAEAEAAGCFGVTVARALTALRRCPAGQLTARVAALADALATTALRVRPPALRRVLNFKACRGAIKFNDPVPLPRLRAMVGELAQCQNPFACAHGRPAGAPVAILSNVMWEEQEHDSEEQ